MIKGRRFRTRLAVLLLLSIFLQAVFYTSAEDHVENHDDGVIETFEASNEEHTEEVEGISIDESLNEVEVEDSLPVEDSGEKEATLTQESMSEENEGLLEENTVANDEVDPTVSQENTTIVINKPHYLSGEEVVFDLKLNLSYGEIKEGDKIEIIIPKKHVIKESISSQIKIMDVLPEVIEDQDSYKLLYQYNSPTDGVNAIYSFKFLTEDGNTPDGYLLELEANIANKESDSSKTTINVQEPVLEKLVKVGNSSPSNGEHIETYVIGGISTSNPGHLTDNLNDLYFVTYTFDLKSSNTRIVNRVYE